MMVESAVGQVIGDGHLRKRCVGTGADKFQIFDLRAETPWSNPADTITRGERFGEGAAEEHATRFIEGLGGFWLLGSKGQTAVNVIFNEWNAPGREQLDELHFFVFR